LSRDEPDDGFPEAALDVGGGFLLSRTADLPDHHDRLGRGVLREEIQRIDEAGADERIPTDPDAGRLP
jgi:hypothetical protein